MGICQGENNGSVNMFQEKATQWGHKWYITTVLTAWAGTPVRFVLAEWSHAMCVAARLTLRRIHSFLPPPSAAGQPDDCGSSQRMTTLIWAAIGKKKGIHLRNCQSRYHGDGLETLRWWQGSGNALPGGSCVLIWVAKDASGLREMEWETMWENERMFATWMD